MSNMQSNEGLVIALRCPWCKNHHELKVAEVIVHGRRFMQVVCKCGASGQRAKIWLTAVRRWNIVCVKFYKEPVPSYQLRKA